MQRDASELKPLESSVCDENKYGDSRTLQRSMLGSFAPLNLNMNFKCC